MAHSLYFVGIVAMHHADSLTPSEVAVLQALVQLHNVPNGVHPSVTWLCRESRLSRRAVNYALASLTERGALKVTPRYNDKGSQTSNDYRFNWPAFLNERGMAFIREEMSSLPEGHEFGNSWTPEEEDLEEENPKQGALVDVPTPPAAPRRNRRQPETPIPDDWKPTEAHRRLADDRGVSLQYEAEQMNKSLEELNEKEREEEQKRAQAEAKKNEEALRKKRVSLQNL